ncbi:ABC transporter permease [bacterium]|nr:ABC transporter permease [bacterium]
MRKTLLFAMREYKAAVRTKGFIIGLVIAPILMSGSILAFVLLKDKVDTTDRRIAVIDRTGRVASKLLEFAEYHNTNETRDPETGEKIRPLYLFNVVDAEEDAHAQYLRLSDSVRSGALYAFLVVGADVVHPTPDAEDAKLSYYARNAALDDLREWLMFQINTRLRQLRLYDAGVDERNLPDLFYWVGVEGLGLVSRDESTGTIEEARQASPIEAIAVPIGIMMIMFLMIMMSVPGMLHSVMEEKTQRIAEVLLGAIKPFEFMMGKLIGGIAVSLTSSSVYIIGAIVAVSYMGYDDYIPFHVLPWFVVYMLLAVVMFGALTAALGSTCSEAKDAQSLSFPSLIPAIIPMFIYFPVAKEPLSAFSTWVSLIPPFTPTLMLLRMATPEPIPIWQPIAGLIGVLLCTVLFVWAGGRIFRVAILMQGTPPKLSNIVRWALRG